jgi:hypothetical protein
MTALSHSTRRKLSRLKLAEELQNVSNPLNLAMDRPRRGFSQSARSMNG